MKCPFCKKQIRYLGTDLFTCDTCHIMLPAKHWIAYIDTRKALDVAIKALTSIMEHPEDIGDAMDAEDALNQIKQITEGPAKNVQKKMSPEEFAELELLVNATFK